MKSLALTGVILGVVAGATYLFVLRVEPLPEGLIQASGRIEGDEITIAADVSGRIVELTAREGDRIEAGDVLVRLDDRAVRARLAQAEKALLAAESAIQKAEADLSASQSRLRAAEKRLDVLREEVPLKIELAQAELKRTRAALATAEANEQKLGRDHRRAETLFRREAVTDEELEAAELLWIESQNQVTSQQARVRIAEQELSDARLGTDRIRAQQAELRRIDADVVRAATAVEARRARRGEAEAARDEAQSVLEDLTIAAPAAGTIVTRIAEPGEVVIAGSPLYSLVDLNRLY